MKFEGGCFCGSVRYQAEGEDLTTVNCHCSMCRRATGAPYVTWFVVPDTQFTFLNEEPASLDSSDHGTRYFCKKCGTHLTCVHPGQADVAVTLGSLDDPENLSPTLEIYTDTKLGWTDGIGSLKQIKPA